MIPLQASHNTVGMRFDIKEADYLHLAKTDASFPLQHFSGIKDTVKMQVGLSVLWNVAIPHPCLHSATPNASISIKEWKFLRAQNLLSFSITTNRMSPLSLLMSEVGIGDCMTKEL